MYLLACSWSAVFLIRHVLRLSCLNGLRPKFSKTHTNTYIPIHTICHTVCGLCDLPAILSLMLIQTPSQSYWHVWETETEYYHHPLLPRLKSMNRLCVFTVYCFFLSCRNRPFCYLSCCWGTCDLDNQICTVFVLVRCQARCRCVICGS